VLRRAGGCTKAQGRLLWLTTARGAPSRRLVAALGVTQIVSWGTMYYAFSLMIDAIRRS
jgi:hypothetical protein